MRQRVLVFGKGSLFQAKEEYIRNTFEIVGFLDNGVSDHTLEETQTDVPVYHPSDTGRYLRPDVMIILMSYQYFAMWEQLRNLGVDGSKILFGLSFPPFSERDEVLFGEGRHLTAQAQGIIYHFDPVHECILDNHGHLQEIAAELLRKK